MHVTFRGCSLRGSCSVSMASVVWTYMAQSKLASLM